MSRGPTWIRQGVGVGTSLGVLGPGKKKEKDWRRFSLSGGCLFLVYSCIALRRNQRDTYHPKSALLDPIFVLREAHKMWQLQCWDLNPNPFFQEQSYGKGSKGGQGPRCKGTL